MLRSQGGREGARQESQAEEGQGCWGVLREGKWGSIQSCKQAGSCLLPSQHLGFCSDTGVQENGTLRGLCMSGKRSTPRLLPSIAAHPMNSLYSSGRPEFGILLSQSPKDWVTGSAPGKILCTVIMKSDVI